MPTLKTPVTCIFTIVHTPPTLLQNRHREPNNRKHSSADIPQPQLTKLHLKSPPAPMEYTLSSTKTTYLLTHPAPTGLCYNTLLTGALIFHPTSPDPPILLLKRRPHENTSPPVFEIPSGQIEDLDPTIFHGLKRIVCQETGLELDWVEDMLGSLSFAVEKGGRG
ncbi:hypothetical protein N7G274_004352 [Stereocaulon virgatum]|uniref:Nudix hydrolase domain-containing protein n=1 Tax=Stereocaulon virgatum TaxID=373712 RepID=A0ABR4AGR8_9LECA